MVQTDFVDLARESIDELAFGELETLFEALHDVHTSVMASVDEPLHGFAETGNAGL